MSDLKEKPVEKKGAASVPLEPEGAKRRAGRAPTADKADVPAKQRQSSESSESEIQPTRGAEEKAAMVAVAVGKAVDGTTTTSDAATSDAATSDDGVPSSSELSSKLAADESVKETSSEDEVLVEEARGAQVPEPANDHDDDDDDDDDEGTITIRYFGATDVGLVREHNEDNFVCVDLEDELRGLPGDATRETHLGERGLILAVCDGMGGAAAGEVASQMAVDTIQEVMQTGGVIGDHDLFAYRLVYAIEEAGSRIFGAAKMDRSRRGMGTTSTVAGLIDDTLFVGQVGDSRCYVLRDRKLKLITKDQSLVNQLIEAGQLTEEEAEEFEHSNIILQALGTTEEVTVDLTFLRLRRGDRVMLCSDGLSGLVHAELIQDVMADEDDLETMTHRLIEMANAGGGHDNITCIIAEFGGDGLPTAETDAPPATYMQYPLPPFEGNGGSVPAREPTMKSGARKPGSDVKRAPGSMAGSSRGEDGRSAPFWPIALVLLALAILAAVFVFARGGSEAAEDENETEETPQLPPPIIDEPLMAPVDVRIHTDVIGGELFVDGDSYGPLEEGVPVRLELLPGAYRVEARREGSALAAATVTVRENEPVDVNLLLPGGSVDTSPDPDEGRPTTDRDSDDSESDDAVDEGTGSRTQMGRAEPSGTDQSTPPGQTEASSTTTASMTANMTTTASMTANITGSTPSSSMSTMRSGASSSMTRMTSAAGSDSSDRGDPPPNPFQK